MSTFSEIFNSRMKAPAAKLGGDLGFQSHFTAYFNMARQNCCIILGRLSQFLGFKADSVLDTALSSSPILGKKGLCSKKKEVSDFIRGRLMSAFPMLDPMIRYRKSVNKEEKDFDKIIITSEDVCRMLTDLLDVLSYYRDMASHVVLDDERTGSSEFAAKEKVVTECLNYMMTVSLRTVKDRFSLEKSDLEFYNGNRYKMVGRKPQLNTAFPHAIRTEDYRLSLMGIVFLCCQFIEKQYATMFFDVLKDRFYKIADTLPKVNAGTREHKKYVPLYTGKDAENQIQKQRMVLREAYSVFRVRIPKERLDSTRSDMALALDMLNELGKCPDVLFDHLSPSDRESFKVEDGILMRRSGDRFPQLALRWLDENRKFSRLRFHVTFGKYRWCLTENKHCVDGLSRHRWLQKELNGFGRIQDIESRRTGLAAGWDGVGMIRKFEDVVSDEEQKDPYITDFRTQYLFNGDKIGVSLREYMPSLEDIHAKKSDVRHDGVPDFYLSVYDLPAMLFLTYILKDSCSQVEQLLVNCKAAYTKLFDDLAKAEWEGDIPVSTYSSGDGVVRYTLGWHDVPMKIRRVMPLTGGDRNFSKKKSFDELARAMISRMRERTVHQLDRFRKELASAKDFKGNKQGKSGFVDIRAGRLANFLARDIVRMMPVMDNGRNKPTGLNYCIIQKEIAAYGTGNGNAEALKSVFRNARIIGVQGGSHPFLEKLLNERRPASVLDFYKWYLEYRIKYLDALKDKSESEIRNVSFLKSGRQKYAVDQEGYAARLADSYRKRPIYLPTGMFTGLIGHHLGRIDVMAPSMTGKERLNASYMISRYFAEVEKDGEQPLYRMARNYRVFDYLEFSKEPKYWSLNDRKGKVLKYKLGRRTQFWDRMGVYYDGLEKYYNGYRNQKTAVDWRTALKEVSVEKARWKELRNRPEEERFQMRDYRFYSRLVNARKEFDDCERTLRRMMVQDMILFLVARESLKLPKDKVFKLKSLSFSGGANSILSSSIDEFSMDVAWPDKSGEDTVMRTSSIREKNVVVKNYGRMFKLVHDERVKTLLPHLHDSAVSGNPLKQYITVDGDKVIIDKSMFDEELAHYDIHRHDICRAVLKFEAAAIKLYGLKGRVDFKVAKDAAAASGQLDVKEADVLSAIRNAYNHNKYPVKGKGVKVNVGRIPHLTEDFLRIFSQTGTLK